ncbi:MULTISPECIES: pyridoxamine 5'-phosphate oxidase family protein [Deinococcus]|uniref:General stress protein n=1 Tax=Deinococcus cavernae TaxID=2320857 RepID=A0A418VCN5_9DEIO|nr:MULTISPECIES: pyridoxamine 5'-phosphate oxidase family protein [Deinococcus]RJF73914.1 general stress protein [Deinococcus cavernae]
MSETTREEAIKIMAGIVKDVKFAMLTTTTAEGHLHARPMTTQEKEYDGDLWFIGAKDTEAVADMRARPQVNVSFSNPDKGTYLSVNGTAELLEDRAKLDELWSDFYKAYFPQGKEDPNIQLIKINASGAEFWESDGKVRSLFQMAKGLIKGEQPDMGKNDTVKL